MHALMDETLQALTEQVEALAQIEPMAKSSALTSKIAPV